MERYYLGLDWGKAKIGVALADDETRLAFGHTVLRNDEKLFDSLKELQKAYPFTEVVMGIPQHAAQHSHKEDIKRFGVLLERELGVKVSYFTEMFTTKMAQANRLERGRMKDLDADDKEASRIILQEWLEM